MTKIYTIGFTKKNAKDFFNLIQSNNIDLIVDVRLNNTSQLAGFSKYPDIEYFISHCSKALYKSDKSFAPEETTLKDYKSKAISWRGYVDQFQETMKKRDIINYILENYQAVCEKGTICFLCSEETADYCHRRLVAELFAKIFNKEIVHLK